MCALVNISLSILSTGSDWSLRLETSAVQCGGLFCGQRSVEWWEKSNRHKEEKLHTPVLFLSRVLPLVLPHPFMNLSLCRGSSLLFPGASSSRHINSPNTLLQRSTGGSSGVPIKSQYILFFPFVLKDSWYFLFSSSSTSFHPICLKY